MYIKNLKFTSIPLIPIQLHCLLTFLLSVFLTPLKERNLGPLILNFFFLCVVSCVQSATWLYRTATLFLLGALTLTMAWLSSLIWGGYILLLIEKQREQVSGERYTDEADTQQKVMKEEHRVSFGFLEASKLLVLVLC